MDNYEMKKQIDVDGPGKVFEVVKKGGKEIYAMKVIDLNKDVDEKSIKDELNLIKFISIFNHPNVIRYIDYFWNKDKNQCVIVMEYFPKGNLRKVINKYSSAGEYIPERQILKYFSDILSGVDSLCTKEIVHRDLRPENILIGDDGYLKVSGFGITNRLCRPDINKLFPTGNFRYMS